MDKLEILELLENLLNKNQINIGNNTFVISADILSDIERLQHEEKEQIQKEQERKFRGLI